MTTKKYVYRTLFSVVFAVLFSFVFIPNGMTNAAETQDSEMAVLSVASEDVAAVVMTDAEQPIVAEVEVSAEKTSNEGETVVLTTVESTPAKLAPLATGELPVPLPMPGPMPVPTPAPVDEESFQVPISFIRVDKIDGTSEPIVGASLELIEDQGASLYPFVEFISDQNPVMVNIPKKYVGKKLIMVSRSYYDYDGIMAGNNLPAYMCIEDDQTISYTSGFEPAVTTSLADGVTFYNIKNNVAYVSIGKGAALSAELLVPMATPVGAELALYAVDGVDDETLIRQWTITENHNEENFYLPNGNYKLKELTTPAGYLPAQSDIKFYVEGRPALLREKDRYRNFLNGFLRYGSYAHVSYLDDPVVVVDNKARVKIYNTGFYQDRSYGGAVFEVRDTAGTVVKRFETVKDVLTECMLEIDKEYVIHEIFNAPELSPIYRPIHFKVDDTGQVLIKLQEDMWVPQERMYLPGVLRISSTNAMPSSQLNVLVHKNNLGNLLANVKMRSSALYLEDYDLLDTGDPSPFVKEMRTIDEWTTTDKLTEAYNVPFIHSCVWRIEELAVPVGYKKIDPIYVKSLPNQELNGWLLYQWDPTSQAWKILEVAQNDLAPTPYLGLGYEPAAAPEFGGPTLQKLHIIHKETALVPVGSTNESDEPENPPKTTDVPVTPENPPVTPKVDEKPVVPTTPETPVNNVTPKTKAKIDGFSKDSSGADQASLRLLANKSVSKESKVGNNKAIPKTGTLPISAMIVFFLSLGVVLLRRRA